jgi:hypothetical protein
MILNPLENIKGIKPAPTEYQNTMTGEITNPSVLEQTGNDAVAKLNQIDSVPAGTQPGTMPTLQPAPEQQPASQTAQQPAPQTNQQPAQAAPPVQSAQQPPSQPNVVDLRNTQSTQPTQATQPVTQQAQTPAAPSPTSPVGADISNRLGDITQQNKNSAQISNYQDKVNSALNDSGGQDLSLNDIYNLMNPKDSSPEALAAEQKKKQTEDNIYNIADIADAFTNLIGTTKGAPNRKTLNLTGANEQRYEKIIANRMAMDKNYRDSMKNVLDMYYKNQDSHNKQVNQQATLAQGAMKILQGQNQNISENRYKQDTLAEKTQHDTATQQETVTHNRATEKSAEEGHALTARGQDITAAHNNAEENIGKQNLGLSKERLNLEESKAGNAADKNKILFKTRNGFVKVDKTAWDNGDWRRFYNNAIGNVQREAQRRGVPVSTLMGGKSPDKLTDSDKRQMVENSFSKYANMNNMIHSYSQGKIYSPTNAANQTFQNKYSKYKIK